MLPVLFSFGPITISSFGFFALLSFIGASYFLWRKLRDDYHEEDILSLTIILSLGAILGARFVYVLNHLPEFSGLSIKWFFLRSFPGFSPLGAVLTGVLVLSLWSRKKNWDFWLGLDFLAASFFGVLVLLSVGLILSSGERFYLLLLGLSFSSLVFSCVLAKTYRKFIWYRSGKLGFCGLLSLSFFFLFLFLIEIFLKVGVYWERITNLLMTGFLLGFLYRRSERSLREDLGTLLRPFKISRKEE